MSEKLQAIQSIKINAPREVVWDYLLDLERIPEYHPRVIRVDLTSGDKYRRAGATYTCYIGNGKHFCTERDTKVIPMSCIITSLPHDTIGLSMILKEYIVETHFRDVGNSCTEMEFQHYYSTPGLHRYLLNFLIKPKIIRQSFEILSSIKRSVEQFTRKNKVTKESEPFGGKIKYN